MKNKKLNALRVWKKTEEGRAVRGSTRTEEKKPDAALPTGSGLVPGDATKDKRKARIFPVRTGTQKARKIRHYMKKGAGETPALQKTSEKNESSRYEPGRKKRERFATT
jgi:hypothetical protein